MSSFSPSPRAIFEAAATVSGMTMAHLRNLKNTSEDVVRPREMAWLLARLWTPCTPEQIPQLMGMKNVDAAMVVEGISEAAKSLFYGVEEVRDVLMHQDGFFDYHERSNKDMRLASGICAIFNDKPGSGYVIERHGPMAQPDLLLRRRLMEIDESDHHKIRIRVAEGAILQLNGEHPFMRV